MWGITGRGARLGDSRRSGRALQLGTSRIVVRGPVEGAVLDVAGDLDFSNVHDIMDIVLKSPYRFVSIDLTGLEFIDGAGARGIEMIRDHVEQHHDARPAIVGASPAVERTIRFVRSRDSASLVIH